VAQITSLQQFRNYIKSVLGAPILTVEVADEQLNRVIEDSVQYIQEYNVGVGSDLEYFIFSAASGQSTYPVSGVAGAFDVELAIGMDGINTLFSPAHEILYSDFVNQLNVYGTGPVVGNPSMILTTFDTAMYYLKEIKNHFGKGYTVRFNGNKQVLTITPTPTANIVGVLYLYRKEDAINLYNHPLTKKLAIAKAKVQWGGNIGKYQALTLPDGSTINGREIAAEGKTEEVEIEEFIRQTSAPPNFFVG